MFPGSNYVYYAMYFVGLAIALVINLKTYDRYNIKKGKTVFYTLLTFFLGIAGALLMGKIYTAVNHSLGVQTSGSVAIFGAVFFCPVFVIAFLFVSEKLFGAKKSHWRDVMDLLSSGVFIVLTTAKLGCFFNGCCHGVESSFGVYNSRVQTTVFPVQLFEICTMTIILLASFYYTFRSKKFIRGTVYPVTALMYSVSRFCWEFLRYYTTQEERHLIFGLTFWQAMCILVFVLSAVSIALLKNVKEKPQVKKIVHRKKR